MNIDQVVGHLRQLLGDETLQANPGLLGEWFLTLPAKQVQAAVDALVNQLNIRHLSTITGQDAGDGIELLYHFWQGHGLTLRTRVPKNDPHITSLTSLIPGAAFYEREVAEMLHVAFDGHPDPRPLLLSDEWGDCPPLRGEGSVRGTGPVGSSRVETAQAYMTEEHAGRMIIPIGPQHPMLKEPLSYLMAVEGERVVDSMLRIGYVHRGIERLCQERTYIQNLYLLERVCGICSHVHTTTYCQGVEALLGIEIPDRAQHLRMLMCELERIHSHLLWLGMLAENIGFTTIFMYAWRDRELTLDIMEELSGGRVAHAANAIGGVRVDTTPDHVRSVLKRLDDLERQVERFHDVVTHETSFRARTRNVGHLSLEQVQDYCVVGPMARASGLDVDLRRDMPYAIYKHMPVRVITAQEGDVWARTVVRMAELLESLEVCRRILQDLPDGPLKVKVPRRVPPGEVVSRIEAPRGEVIYYIRSDGTDKPARVKIRTPTLTSLITLDTQMRNINIADIPAVLGGMDLCIACADR